MVKKSLKLSNSNIQFITNSSEQSLKEILKQVYKGSKENYAVVAFVGGNVKDYLDVKIKNLKVVCNGESLGTNPEGLQYLSNKLKSNLKSNKSLHSKIYLSEKGALVGSANLSANALELLEKKKGSMEAMVWIPASKESEVTYKNIKSYCSKIFKNSKAVDEGTIEKLTAERARKKVSLMSSENLILGLQWGECELDENVKLHDGTVVDDWFEEPYISKSDIAELSDRDLYSIFEKKPYLKRISWVTKDVVAKKSRTTVFHLTKSNLDKKSIAMSFRKDLMELRKLINDRKIATLKNHFKDLKVIVCRHDKTLVSGFYFRAEDLTKVLECARLLKKNSKRPSR